MIVALAGGVGAARFLRGLVRAVDPSEVTVIVNTGDDIDLHGLRICPDLDSVTYALADANDTERGWGMADETWHCIEGMRRYDMPGSWFNLGDRDLATHLFRTSLLHDGTSLTDATDAITKAWRIRTTLLPMSEDHVVNTIVCATPGCGDDGDGADETTAMHFQQYLVQHRAAPAVLDVRYDGAAEARALPAALDAIADADVVIVCPSNPVVSIGTILAVPGYREALTERRCPAVAVSPIIGGAAVRGPADPLMRAVGMPVSAAGVASAYRGLVDGFVVDDVDADLEDEVERTGARCSVAATLMTDDDAAARLARHILDFAGSLGTAGVGRG